MEAGSGGLDHLGLASVSQDQILPALAPSINVLTDHPRYHSFYVFVLDEFWRRERPRSPKAWVDFYRPREFILALATHLCDRPEHGNMPAAVGSQKIAGLARRRLAAYDKSFNYIKRDLGGYGLYYRSVMTELGLVYPGGRGLPYPVDVPSEHGTEVAAAFRREIENTAYYHDFFDDDSGDVPIDVVEAYARTACLCQLRLASAADRPLVRDTFLHGGADEQAEQRRLTMRLLLDIAMQTTGHGLDEDRFRQLVYFHADSGGATFAPRPALESTARNWRLYQAREYYALALNGLWCHFCDWGVARGGETLPIPLREADTYIAASLGFEAVASELGLPKPDLDGGSRFDDLVEWVTSSGGFGQTQDDRTGGIDQLLNEHRLTALLQQRRKEAIAIPTAVTLLATLAGRFELDAERFRPEWRFARMGGDTRLSFDAFLRALGQRRSAGQTIAQVTHWLYDDYVILQHELVALGKLPDNTFRFRREGQRLRFTGHQNPLGFNNSRFAALTTTLAELGLCDDIRDPDHRVSPDGLALLENDDLT